MNNVVVAEQSALVPLNDIERMAGYMVKSGLFGIKTPEQAVALMLIAQAEGMHPALASRDYHIIQGRHSLKADAMLARFISSGGKVQWHTYTDTEVSATFSHPSGGSVQISWDMARAKQADLGSKDNWKKYPRQMLRARVISEGIRTVYPGVAVGVYTPEEVQDFDEAPRMPQTVKSTVVDKPQTEVIKDKLKGKKEDEPDSMEAEKEAFALKCAELAMSAKEVAAFKQFLFPKGTAVTRELLKNTVDNFNDKFDLWQASLQA